MGAYGGRSVTIFSNLLHLVVQHTSQYIPHLAVTVIVLLDNALR